MLVRGSSLSCAYRCLEKGKPNPVLLPHVVQDELLAVCESCNNINLKGSEFGILLKTIQEVRGVGGG